MQYTTHCDAVGSLALAVVCPCDLRQRFSWYWPIIEYHESIYIDFWAKTIGSIHRGGYHILYPVSNLTTVHIQMDMVLVTFGYSTHLA